MGRTTFILTGSECIFCRRWPNCVSPCFTKLCFSKSTFTFGGVLRQQDSLFMAITHFSFSLSVLHTHTHTHSNWNWNFWTSPSFFSLCSVSFQVKHGEPRHARKCLFCMPKKVDSLWTLTVVNQSHVNTCYKCVANSSDHIEAAFFGLISCRFMSFQSSSRQLTEPQTLCCAPAAGAKGTVLVSSNNLFQNQFKAIYWDAISCSVTLCAPCRVCSTFSCCCVGSVFKHLV